MAQASIYWDMENYAAIEKLFRKSFEFCNDHDVWRLNAGHVLFMQENNKFKKAIDFYEPIVKKYYDSLLNVSPIVLANLCVSYVMSNQNDEVNNHCKSVSKLN